MQNCRKMVVQLLCNLRKTNARKDSEQSCLQAYELLKDCLSILWVSQDCFKIVLWQPWDVHRLPKIAKITCMLRIQFRISRRPCDIYNLYDNFVGLPQNPAIFAKNVITDGCMAAIRRT